MITDPSGRAIGPSPLPLSDNFARFELETDEAITLHVVTFARRENGGPDLETCGIAIRGNGAPLNRAAHYFVSQPVDPEDDAAIALTESAVADSIALGLTHATNACVQTYPCERVMVSRFESPQLGMHALHAFALDDSRAYVSLVGAEPDPARVLELKDDRATILFSSEELGAITRLAFDGTRGWGATDHAQIFSFDFSGTITSTFARGGTGLTLRVASDGHGTVIVYGEDGVEVLSGSNETQRAAIESLNIKVEFLALSSPDRIVAIADNSLNYFDGASWTVERELAPVVFEEYFDLYVDEEVAAAAGKDERVTFREESTKTWGVLPPIDGDSVSLKSVAGLGDDRFMAVGEVGLAAIYANGVWCAIDTDTTNTLDAVAVAPSGRVAYATGRFSPMTDFAPVLLRFDLPE